MIIDDKAWPMDDFRIIKWEDVEYKIYDASPILVQGTEIIHTYLPFVTISG